MMSAVLLSGLVQVAMYNSDPSIYLYKAVSCASNGGEGRGADAGRWLVGVVFLHGDCGRVARRRSKSVMNIWVM